MTASTVRSSGSPPSLFPGGHTPVPPQSTSGFPLPEKNPKTHGVLASQDSVPQGRESWPPVKASKNSKIEPEVIDLSVVTHVVLRKCHDRKEVRMLRSRTAHARSKKKRAKAKTRISTSRPTCSSLTDCATRTRWVATINISPYFLQ